MSSAVVRRRVVLDTDTFNEVDDQFAMAHLLLSTEQIDLEAVHAAPFLNSRSSGPADGMEKSYEEIQRVLELVKPVVPPRVFRGSTAFLPGPDTPMQSEAAVDLIERALAVPEEKLYVAGIAAATNIASAILIEPKIIDRIVVIWLGGNASYWPHTREFNLKQDIHAARILFESGVPFIHLPCQPVASHLIMTLADLQEQLAPYSRLGKYLTEIVRNYSANPPGWSKVIWDIAVSAWLVNPDWVSTREIHGKMLRDDLTWETAPTTIRHTIREAITVNRNAIFGDFFAKAKTADGLGV